MQENRSTSTPCRPLADKLSKARRFLQTDRHARVLTRLMVFGYGVFLVLMCEILHYHDAGALFYDYLLARPLVFLGSVLLVSVIYLGLMCLARRAFLAAAACTLFFYLFGVVEHFKLLILEENLYPWDFYMLRNAGQMAGFVDIGPSVSMVVLFLLGVGFVLFFALCDYRLPGKLWLRLPFGALLLGAAALYLVLPFSRFHLMPVVGLYVNDTVMQQSNYQHNGLIGGFALNIGNLAVPVPEGYSETRMDQLLAEYDGSGVSEHFLYPDILIVMSESFFDVNGLEKVSYERDPLAEFQSAAAGEHARCGAMVSPTLGGGTVRTELEFLTGLTVGGLPDGSVPYQQYIRAPLWTYADLYDDLGYTTIAMHTNTRTFYDRDKGYEFMGFDAFFGSEDLQTRYPQIPARVKGGYTSDDSFTDYMLELLQSERRADEPMLIYGISMENHQSYVDKYSDDELDLHAASDTLSPEHLDIAENVGQGIYDADQCLGRLRRYVDQAERPTVLLFFGDHLPTLGTSHSVMVETNFVHDETWDEDDLYRMYTPPYLMYANFALKEDAFVPAGGAVCSYNLFNYLSDAIDAPYTDYMAFLRAYYEIAPVYNRTFRTDRQGREIPGAELYDKAHLLFSYDRIAGKRYSQRDREG